jgi:hypothetical protein
MSAASALKKFSIFKAFTILVKYCGKYTLVGSESGSEISLSILVYYLTFDPGRFFQRWKK